jgi:hypothetical protein
MLVMHVPVAVWGGSFRVCATCPRGSGESLSAGVEQPCQANAPTVLTASASFAYAFGRTCTSARVRCVHRSRLPRRCEHVKRLVKDAFLSSESDRAPSDPQEDFAQPMLHMENTPRRVDHLSTRVESNLHLSRTFSKKWHRSPSPQVVPAERRSLTRLDVNGGTHDTREWSWRFVVTIVRTSVNPGQRKPRSWQRSRGSMHSRSFHHTGGKPEGCRRTGLTWFRFRPRMATPMMGTLFWLETLRTRWCACATTSVLCVPVFVDILKGRTL